MIKRSLPYLTIIAAMNLQTGCRMAMKSTRTTSTYNEMPSLSVDAFIELRRETQGGKTVYVLENDRYRSVFVPEIARFPLSLLFKPTEHEHFAQPQPLSTPNDGFQYYGGIVDSLPWVSGRFGDVRLPDKGFLFAFPWKVKTDGDRLSAWIEGICTISYDDPMEHHTSELTYHKRVTGFAGSSVIRMEQRIVNTGGNPARFIFAAHARTQIADWDEGDYFYAPGDRCRVYYMNNQPALAERGIDPPCDAPWPLSEATDFVPGPPARNVFCFVPSDWCVVGDDKHLEALFFIGSPIRRPGRTDTMQMGIFMTHRAYLVEPALTPSIQATESEWSDPELNIVLAPGEECTFELYLVPHHGIARADLASVTAVHPEGVVLNGVRRVPVPGSDRFTLTGTLVAAAHGTLRVRDADAATAAARAIAPGAFSLTKLGEFSPSHEGELHLVFHTASGERVLASF